MKNKIIINILVVYFLILSFVLIIQITSKETNAIEPLPTEITAEDKLKNSVVLAINSPIILVNEKQFLIDKNDSTVTPIIENGKIYIPVTLLETGFNANISFSPSRKETTVRLNNKAIIFYNDTKTISVIDNISEETVEIETNSKIINNRFYVPIKTFSQIFEKEVFVYNDLIIISDIKDIFDPMEEIETINGILQRVNYLPIVGNEENLKKLIYSFNPKKVKEKQEKLFLTKEITEITTQQISTIEQATQLETNNNSTTLENSTETTSEVIQTQNSNTRYYIKTINNYNFYINAGVLEVFVKDNENNTEQLSFRLELYNNDLVDIILDENNLVLTYSSLGKRNLEQEYTTVIVYDITDKNSIKKLSEVNNNGAFYENKLNEDYLYTITKLDANKMGSLPLVEKRYYENNSGKEYFKKEFNLNEIYYFPDINDKQYTAIIITNIRNNVEYVNCNIFFGMGENIILNEDNLYVSTSKNEKTNIYLFELSFGNIDLLKRVFLNGEIEDIKNSIIFDESSIKIKTDKEEKIYTKELKVVE